MTQKPAEKCLLPRERRGPGVAVYVPGSMSVILCGPDCSPTKSTPLQDVLLFL